jgi:hypothetical protein
MRMISKFATAALVAGAAAFGVSAPASADHVSVSIGIGGPAYVGDYDWYRPCGWYFHWNLPAPARCYHDYYGFYGPNIYVYDGFVFRDRDDWGRWQDRDDFHHWRLGEYRRADWHHYDWDQGHDNGEHRGWRNQDWGHDEGRHDHGHGRGHGHDDWDGDHGHGHDHD